MLLILLCIYLHYATTSQQSLSYPTASSLARLLQMSDKHEAGCGMMGRSLIQSIRLFQARSLLETSSTNRAIILNNSNFASDILSLEPINLSVMEEDLGSENKYEAMKTEEPGERNEESIPINLELRAKQELTSFLHHQNSKISHILQSEIKNQTEQLSDTAVAHCFSYSQLFFYLALFGMVSATAVYSLHSYSHRQKQVLKTQLTLLQSEKEQIQDGLNKEIEVLKYKSHFYEIFWDRLVSQVSDKKCYDHLIYEGRFLNLQTYVYVVKMEGIDLHTVQRKLKKLLTCSHSRLSKLYFYVREGQHLLAFTEKIIPLASKQLPDFLNINASEQSKRNLITEIIETVDYLQAKIELKWLPLHSIQLQYLASKETPSFQFKINAIPCLFRKMPNTCGDQENDTCHQDIPCFVRNNIAALFHLILMNGRPLVPCQLKKSQPGNQEYFQFLSFILYQAKAIGHTHQLLFKQVKQHPFLWDTTRKILFISDFSNFIQTHLDEQKIQRLEQYAKHFNVVQNDWGKPFHFLFAQEINIYRKYDFSSMRDLVRMIRNKLNHFHEIPKEVRVYVGRTPEKFMEYCLMKFPKLLYFAYNYTRKKKWRLHVK